jgi:DNA-binding beta-propeller fold protein YncE
MTERPGARLYRGMAITAVGCVTAFGAASTFGVPSAAATVAQFGSKGAGAGQFFEPSGVAAFQQTGDVYLADTNNGRLDKFGPEGAFLFAVGWGVRDGEDQLEVCSSECRAGISGAGAGQFSGPDGVAVDNNPASESYGDVYAVDSQNHRVQKFDSTGHFLLTFGKEVNTSSHGDVCTAAESESCGAGTEGTGPGEFLFAGGGIAVDNNATVYVGSWGRVEEFTESGEYVSEFAVSEGGLVRSLAVNSSHEIYVIDINENVVGVHHYGLFGTELGSPIDTAGSPQYLTLGPHDELFIDDGPDEGREQPHLLEYDSTGAELASFDIGTEGGSRGIAYGDAVERVYVLNDEAVRLVALPPPGPLIAPGSEAVTHAKPGSATVTAGIDAEGSAVTYHFDYGETASYGRATASQPLNEEPGLFAVVAAPAELTSLLPSTTYHFRVVAEDAHGHITVGPDATFTTPLPALISGESATQVTPESARLEADINPFGVETHYRFEYGLDTSYGHSAPEPEGSTGAGEGSASHGVVVEHLEPGMTYHYRVVTHSDAFGTTSGPDRTFTTPPRADVLALADGRAWEMVSPPNKNGAVLEAMSEEGGLIQASESGEGLAYISLEPAGAEAPGEGSQSIADTQLLAKRVAPGSWRTQDITTPHEQPTGFKPANRAEYMFFSGDLASALVEPFGATPLSPQTTERTPYLRETTGGYTPLLTASNVPSGTRFGGSVQLVGGAPELSEAVISSPAALTPGVSPPEESQLENLYLWSRSTHQLQLVSWLSPTSEAPREAPAVSVEDTAHLGYKDKVVRHAVSQDGTRLIYEASRLNGESAHLFMRDLSTQRSVELDLSESGSPGPGANVRFQDASADGRVVFFTDSERLTADATGVLDPVLPKSDLYECEMQQLPSGLHCALRNLTVPLNAAEPSEVLGNIVGTDEGGTDVYYVANGKLTPDAVHGDCPPDANPGEVPETNTVCNLYAFDAATDQTRLVAVISGQDFPDWGGNAANLSELTARVSPNGRFLAFMSQRSLTGYDNRDAQSGEPDEEVYEYDLQANRLTCASCDPTGARPTGVFDPGTFPGMLIDRARFWRQQWLAAAIPGWTREQLEVAPYQSRYLSSNGRLFFNGSDGLVPQDVNGQFDVYEYEPEGTAGCGAGAGCVALMSSGQAGTDSAFLDASSDGEDLFFLTTAKLSASDTDPALDVYDAHVCSPGAPCPAPSVTPAVACDELSSCRPASAPAVSLPTPPTLGSGNVAPAAPTVAKKRLTRAQLLAKALRQCKKKRNGKRRRACIARAKRRYGAKHATRHRSRRKR